MLFNRFVGGIKMHKLSWILAFTFFMLGMSYHGVAGETITISGTGDNEILLRVLAKAFEAEHPDTTILIPKTISTAGGIVATAEGRCDLGRTARAIKENEKKYNLNYTVFAYSPIAFAVNSDIKGVDNLTTQQILDIYSGTITSWDKLGGPEEKIFVIQREPGDAALIVIEKVIAGWKDIKSFTGEIIYTTPEVPPLIKKYKGTIGYLPLDMAKAEGLTIFKIDGIDPSNENVQNGNYKLVSPFGLVWKGELKGLAKAFVDFVLSPQGQKLIAENGAVPVQ